MNSKDKKVGKFLKYATKRKTWYNNFHTPIQALVADFAAFSLFCLISHTLSLSCLWQDVAAGSALLLSSHPRLSILSLSYPVPALSSCLISNLLSLFIPALLSGPILALISHFLSASLFFICTPAIKLPFSTSDSRFKTSTTL